jgi:hypothetical protein
MTPRRTTLAITTLGFMKLSQKILCLRTHTIMKLSITQTQRDSETQHQLNHT